MLTSLDKSQFVIDGERGLPENYPIPSAIDGLLFYIQRNLNKNTVVYVLNKNMDGSLNESFPMKVFWIKYTSGGKVQELNYIQNKLAYGYRSIKISDNLFEFSMVSYDKLRFFLCLDPIMQEYRVVTKMYDKNVYLSNIYVYAEEFGLFPDVKYIELYGVETDPTFPCYQRILI
jgi:hypothetical protein